jgi:integrase
VIEFDGQVRGLGLRTQGSRKTWIVRYHVDGVRRQVTLGDARPPGGTGGLTRTDARRLADDYRRDARAGIDRQAADEAQKAARKQAAELAEQGRLGVLFEDYLAHAATRLRPGTFVEARRYLRTHLAPLHERPASELTTGELRALLRTIASTNGPTASNRCRAYLSAALNWARGEEQIDRNPIEGVKPLTPETRRERVLDDRELTTVWRACGDDDYGRIVRLLVLTGQRREEIGGLRWGEVDLERAEIRLPGARTKNKRPHVIPLAPAALAILESVRRRTDRELLFGRTGGEGGFGGWSKAKAALDARLDPKLEAWALHDLRRSVVTGMAELGIAPHVIEAVVNHVSGHKAGVAGIYNRAQYGPEKRQALERWARHVREIVTGEERPKVVPLRA